MPVTQFTMFVTDYSAGQQDAEMVFQGQGLSPSTTITISSTGIDNVDSLVLVNPTTVQAFVDVGLATGLHDLTIDVDGDVTIISDAFNVLAEPVVSIGYGDLFPINFRRSGVLTASEWFEFQANLLDTSDVAPYPCVLDAQIVGYSFVNNVADPDFIAAIHINGVLDTQFSITVTPGSGDTGKAELFGAPVAVSAGDFIGLQAGAILVAPDDAVIQLLLA